MTGGSALKFLLAIPSLHLVNTRSKLPEVIQIGYTIWINAQHLDFSRVTAFFSSSTSFRRGLPTIVATEYRVPPIALPLRFQPVDHRSDGPRQRGRARSMNENIDTRTKG